MIKEIFETIAARTDFTPGDTIHLGRWPQGEPDRSVLVAFNGGGAVVFDLPDRQDVMVQILTRAKDYNTAYADAMTAFNVLHGAASIPLTVLTSAEEWEAQTIEAVNAPQYLGPDELNRHLWSTNYIWRIKDRAQ